jgi:hypothetical protein
MSAYIFSEITRKRKLPICFLKATGAFPLKNTSQTAKQQNPTDNFLASQYNNSESCGGKLLSYNWKFLDIGLVARRLNSHICILGVRLVSK